MLIHIFGITTAAGQALQKLIHKKGRAKICSYSRNNSDSFYTDLSKPEDFSYSINTENSIVISLVPIWVFSNFLTKLIQAYPNSLIGLNSLIVTSSSSALTKAYAFNQFDKTLSKRLIESENIILSIARKYSIPCTIIRPSMIYGSVSNYNDRNISQLQNIMKYCPFILFPHNSGLRQPIHASQLANVAYNIALANYKQIENPPYPPMICVGGDDQISYYDLLKKIQLSFPKRSPIRNCLIIRIPKRLYLLIIFPILLVLPKIGESLLRVFSDLAGFKESFVITKDLPASFPVNN